MQERCKKCINGLLIEDFVEPPAPGGLVPKGWGWGRGTAYIAAGFFCNAFRLAVFGLPLIALGLYHLAHRRPVWRCNGCEDLTSRTASSWQQYGCLGNIARLFVLGVLVAVALAVIGAFAQQGQRTPTYRPPTAPSPARFPSPAGPTHAQAPSGTAEALYANARASVLHLALESLDGSARTGSGFVIADSVVVTNHHVVDGVLRGAARPVKSGNAYPLESVLASDPISDLALVQISVPGSPPLKIDFDNPARIGEEIFVLSNPKGLEGTLSPGMVSNLHVDNEMTFLQITAPISPGSSGAPVLRRNGTVIGVVTSRVEGEAGLNFAVGVESLLPLIRRVYQEAERSPGGGVYLPQGRQRRRPSPPPASRGPIDDYPNPPIEYFPAEPAEHPFDKGRIAIEVLPTDAKVFNSDGRLLGTADSLLELEANPGTFVLSVVKQGYKKRKVSVTVRLGMTAKLLVILVPDL